MKKTKQLMLESVKQKIKALLSIITTVTTELHPLLSMIFIFATLITILGFQEKGLGGVALLTIAFPAYCISVPILSYSIITRIIPKQETAPITQRKKQASFLYNSLWFLNTTIVTAAFLILLTYGLVFIFALLNLDYIEMLSDLLIIGICILIIFACNTIYCYFEQKLNKTRVQHNKGKLK